MINNFNYYKFNNNLLFSKHEYRNLEKSTESEIKNSKEIVYLLCKKDPLISRSSYSISCPSELEQEAENLNILELCDLSTYDNFPLWISDKIDKHKIMSINTNYPKWRQLINKKNKEKWRLNLIALGDVGSTLLIGLSLLGGKNIESIGIYDRDNDKLNRWEHELNQIRIPFNESSHPHIEIISKQELFDCDMFIFCASKGIPPVGSNVRDVRMAQFKNNSIIIEEYAKLARQYNFKGIFAVVSDPVDLLCKVAFLKSNEDESSSLDFKGLGADQIIGYGLGVMNARACYYAEKIQDNGEYLNEGRVFGPHGEGLIVANSISNYDEEKSLYLTEKTLKANLEVRSFGFKPFVAPSLSSGALSILATIRGDWFYGSTYMSPVYMGSACRLLESGIQVEKFNLPPLLIDRINNTYDKLGSIV